jgi:hypothetical protein
MVIGEKKVFRRALRREKDIWRSFVGIGNMPLKFQRE